MKPIWKAWLCQIDITNVCGRGCVYCSRYDRHIRKDQRYFMGLDFFEKAICSLEEFPGRIGIIGGEPIYHPQFKQMCLLLQEMLPKEKRQRIKIWISDGPLYRKKYKNLIAETFGGIASFNEHSDFQEELQKHQPTTIAVGEAVEPGKYRDKLIDNCWVQRIWCPSITNKGAFFCEIAGALDMILDGPGGYPIEPTWWKRTPEEFQDQVERYCLYCGMPIPTERQFLKDKIERITPRLLDLFKSHNLPKLEEKNIELFNRKFTIAEMEGARPTWDPGNFRGDVREDKCG